MGSRKVVECYLDRGRQKGDDVMRAMEERIGVRASLSGDVSHGFRELIESVGWRLGLLRARKDENQDQNKRKSKIYRTSFEGNTNAPPYDANPTPSRPPPSTIRAQ